MPAENKYNADATTFQFNPDNTGAKVCIVKDPSDKTPITSTNLPSDTCVFIKWMNLCNAAGEMGPLVFIVQVDGIEDGKFFKREIPGLAINGSLENGVIYFCSTRAGNHGLWMDWFSTIVIPFIKRRSDAYNAKVSGFDYC